MKPIIKYRGGKSKEIPNFQQYIPKEYDTYLEPFVGGGAVFFYLEPNKAIINDINQRLTQFYLELQSSDEMVCNELAVLQDLYEDNQKQYEELKANYPDQRVENKNEALYYCLRDMYNHKIPLKYLESVIYFFINKTAYSGMIRYNAQGEYNVPFGRYKHFNTKLITNDHFNLLKRAQVMTGDYSKVFEISKDNDFMFLDPPYDCVFNDYGNLDLKNGFDEQQHRRLASDFRNLSCKAMMVIGKTPLTEELYGNFIKGEYEKSYAVNIRNRFKSESMHIIVTNY